MQPKNKLSVVIPARNERSAISTTLHDLYSLLDSKNIEHELLVVDDGSTDDTILQLKSLEKWIPSLRVIRNEGQNGFGMAVRLGLESAEGDICAVFMADASDCPHDLLRFYREMVRTGVDCVFGTRFHREGKVIDYPFPKLILNRFANTFIRLLFGMDYNDTTNAFKMYRKSALEGLKPYLSKHFNLTVELPLKAIIRGYSYRVLPNKWRNRKTGVSKLKIREMGSRYLFIVLYCFIEKWLSRGDFHSANTRSEATLLGLKGFEASAKSEQPGKLFSQYR